MITTIFTIYTMCMPLDRVEDYTAFREGAAFKAAKAENCLLYDYTRGNTYSCTKTPGEVSWELSIKCLKGKIK